VDNQLNTVTNLNETNYTFVSSKGIFDNRFTLQFTPDGALGTNGDSLETVSIYPNPTQNLVTIVSTQTIVTSATVYDIRGRVVFEVDFSNQTIYQIDLSAMEAAVYFVEIATESGTVNKRVIKRD
jgi:prolyl oligopeptidase PreP (S9A serine peptidase family)